MPGDNIKHGQKPHGRKPPKKITEKYLYNSGLTYLQRFPTSTAHFRRVMLRKIDRSCKAHAEQSRDDCIALLDQAAEKFQHMGLLNDDLYITGMVNSLRCRGLSAQAIAAKLAAKGLPREAIDTVLKPADDGRTAAERDLVAALILARRKRIGPFQTGNQVDPAKALSAIGRAGYSYDVAQQVLSLTLEDAEVLLRENA